MTDPCRFRLRPYLQRNSVDPGGERPCNYTSYQRNHSRWLADSGCQLHYRQLFQLQPCVFDSGNAQRHYRGRLWNPSDGSRPVRGVVATYCSTESTFPGLTTSDYQLGMYSLAGYSTTANLTCQGLPSGASCQFGANNLFVPAGGSASTSAVVNTTSSTAVRNLSLHHPGLRRRNYLDAQSNP